MSEHSSFTRPVEIHVLYDLDLFLGQIKENLKEASPPYREAIYLRKEIRKILDR